MTRDEIWMDQWQQYIDFITTNKRRPSKYKLEEHKLLSWYKHNRKLINQGKMPANRLEKFNELLRAAEKVQRLNQYQYTNGERV
jgi:hypothetical protein